MTTILVTGATGTVGTHLIRELSGHPVRVRAFVRDPRAAAAKLPDAELVAGDLYDTDSIARAMTGVDRLFLSAPDSPDKVAQVCIIFEDYLPGDVRIGAKSADDCRYEGEGSLRASLGYECRKCECKH